MKDDDARLLISQRMDEPLTPSDATALDEHLESCSACRAYAATLEGVRRSRRFESVDEVPDVARRVMAAVATAGRERDSRWLHAAAVFVAAAVAGGAFIGIAGRSGRVQAADVPGLVLQAQRDVDAFSARLAIIERGWHPDVPERSYAGAVEYRAPESLQLTLDDRTAYPSPEWVRNDTALVSGSGSLWWSGPAPCPSEAQPGCTPGEPQTTAVSNAPPFPDATPLPLDLVVPVASFAKGGATRILGEQVVAGRQAIGIEATVAQLDPLLAGLTRAGNWRALHPADRVELWLDRAALIPLALAVLPSDDPDRAVWAARRGYSDDPSVPILEVVWSDITIGSSPADVAPPPPTGTGADAGFRATGADDLSAPRAEVPSGMTPHIAGIQEAGTRTEIRSWSDGRAWLKVSWTDAWSGSGLFGGVGELVRRVVTEEGGVMYVSADGSRVAVHGAGEDLVVTGSVPAADLMAAAASTGVVGLDAPEGWPEARSSDLDAAASVMPGLLVPAAADDFGEPAVRVSSGVVTLAYAGSGSRGYLVVEATGGELSPPLEADVRGVTVRGVAGRFTPGRGTLEWVEGGLAITMRTDSLTAAELVAIADDMETR